MWASKERTTTEAQMQASTRIFGTIEAIVIAATLCSCAVGPDFHPVAAPKVSGYSSSAWPAHTASADVIGGSAQTLQTGGEIPGQWWSLFHSAQLDGLVYEALKANPNITAAQAALREANESAAAEKGFLYPSVTGGVTGLRERLSSIRPEFRPGSVRRSTS
jgi:outer membrane protein TolC